MNLADLSNEELLQYQKRTEQKIAEYHNTQLALKILLNGGYGALSNQHNRWYSDDIAESITLSGQLSARWIIQHVNRFFNKLYKTVDVDYVIAVDTDSIHLNVEPLILKAYPDRVPEHEELLRTLENFSKVMDKVIKEGYDLLAIELNVFESAMHMKLETLCRAIWSGKKHYAMEVWANEGIRYNPPKLKLVGLEAVKSSTPQLIRDWMKELIPLIFKGDAKVVMKFIDDKRVEFSKMPFEAVAAPKTLSDIEKNADPVTIYGKGTPIHVRGALLYNHLIKQMDLENTLQPIRSGDKVRYCYMTLPNPIKENVFTCPDTLPRELSDLAEFIDYATQFDKVFVKPMTALAKDGGLRMTDDIDINQFMF